MALPADRRDTLRPDELRWLKSLARRQGRSLVEMLDWLRQLVRRAENSDLDAVARRREAGAKILEYLGDAAKLSEGDEEAIVREWESDD